MLIYTYIILGGGVGFPTNSMKINKLICTALLGVSVLSFAGCSQQPPQKIGTVNYQVVMQKNPKLAKAQEELSKEYEKVQKMAFDSSIPENERRQKAMDIQSKLMEKQTSLIKPIREEVNKYVKEAADKKQITVVFDKMAVIHGGEDLTKDVLLLEGVSEEDAKKIIEDSEKMF